VTRHGVPILERPVKNRLAHGIESGAAFEEWEACKTAGLDLERWEGGGYDVGFKAKVLAWHRLRTAVEAHITDAQVEFAKFEQRKAARRSRSHGRTTR